MILCALDQSFCTSLEVPLLQPLACFLPIHSHHVPDILPLHLLFFPFVFHFSLFTLLILLWILFVIHFHCSFSPTFLSKTSEFLTYQLKLWWWWWWWWWCCCCWWWWLLFHTTFFYLSYYSKESFPRFSQSKQQRRLSEAGHRSSLRRHAELEAQCKHFFFSFFFTNSHCSPPLLNYFLSLSPTNVGVFLGNFPAPNN